MTAEYGKRFRAFIRKEEEIMMKKSLVLSDAVTCNRFSDTPANIARMVIFNGRVWKSSASLCRAYGIFIQSAFKYMELTGATIEEAVRHFIERGRASEPTAELMERGLCVSYDGQYYHSPSSLARAYGVSQPEVSRLIRNGMSAAEAMDYMLGRSAVVRTAA